MFQGGGALNFDIARQTGLWVATGGKSEPNVDPVQRIRYEELFTIAALHVGEATGLVIEAAAAAGTTRDPRRVGRTPRSMPTSRCSNNSRQGVGQAQSEAEGVEVDPAMGFLGGLGKMMAPVLIGMQAGVMVGQLAQRGLGPYDLPLPRPAGAPLQVMPSNVDAFATEWELPIDDLRLWVLVEELAYHVTLSAPAVRARIQSLVGDYVSGFSVDSSNLEAHLGEIDPGDASSLERVLGNPETLLGAIQTAEQRDTLSQLTAAVAAILGLVDHVMESVGPRITGQPRGTGRSVAAPPHG